MSRFKHVWGSYVRNATTCGQLLTSRHEVQSVWIHSETGDRVQMCDHGVDEFTFNLKHKSRKINKPETYRVLEELFCWVIPVLLSKNWMCRSSWAVMVIGNVGWLSTLLILQGASVMRRGEKVSRRTKVLSRPGHGINNMLKLRQLDLSWTLPPSLNN